MLGKLLKYEFKATGRVLLPIYLVMIVFALVSSLMMKTSFDFAIGISLLIFFGICVASMVLTVVITIQRFQKNLLTDEGYLMFTLPLSSGRLITSKLIVAVVWGIVGTIAGILSGIIFCLLNIDSGDLHLMFTQISHLLSFVTGKEVLAMILALVSSIISYVIFVLIIYLSLSFGQLPIAGKHRNMMSLLAFFGIYIIYSIVGAIFGNIFEYSTSNMNMFTSTSFFVQEFNLILGGALLLEVLFGVALFFVTKYILNKHLNLE